LALHLLQVVIDGAYRAPREVNFWLGLILMKIVLALSLTGYLLPWDQKGYWATRVATNLMGLVPFFGESLQKLVVGGSTYGHATLTRFFALHAGVLPALLIAMLVLHIKVFRRHGIHAQKPDRNPDQSFWPDQVFKDAVACLAVLVVVMFFVIQANWTVEHAGQAPGEYLGAELGAPADPANPYSAARPEWYFLFLFQFLKYFHGETEILGAIVIPGAVMFMLFLMPILGRWKLGHRFNVGLLLILGGGVTLLTVLAKRDDKADDGFRQAKELAEQNRIRAIELAQSPTGIPDSGAVSLLRKDPKTMGPILFTRHCASCHAHVPFDDIPEQPGLATIKSREPSAPNLYGFATQNWIKGFLDPEGIISSDHFGDTKHKDSEEGMVEWVTTNLDYSQITEEEAAELRKKVETVAIMLSAEAKLRSQEAVDAAAEKDGTLEKGRQLIKTEFANIACTECHKFHATDEGGEAPDLTGYGSRQWLIDFISNPGVDRFYGENNDRMPGYAKHPGKPLDNVLSRDEIEMLTDWLRGEWYEPETESSDE